MDGTQHAEADNIESIVFKSNRNLETFAGESVQVGCTAVEISPKLK